MKNQVKMIIFVVILGMISAAILVGTNNLTKAMINDNKDYALKSTILNAFGIDYMKENVLDLYEESITSEAKDNTIFYYTEAGNVGFEFDGSGLWGPIRGFMTLEPDFVTIKGIQIIYNEETPGLGGVVAEQWYLDKYKGKQFDPALIIKKNADVTSNAEVDAITGATMTSNAFQLMLNTSYQERKEFLDQ